LARSQHLGPGQSGLTLAFACSNRGNAWLSRTALSTACMSLLASVFPKCIAIQPEPRV
jgi:hypothetical protein